MPHSQKPVRACICYPNTFATLRQKAQEQGWHTVEQITAATGCGSGCGMCRPYLQKMLDTGEVAFDVIISEEVAALLKRR